MINPKIKQGIQVAGSLAVAIWIFWFLYKDIELASLVAQVRSSNWFWIIFSVLISLLGFYIRGWRWALLIKTDEGKPVSAKRAYHALMIGYLANMLVPRAGEVARCGVLSRTNGISVGHLIGTVILERSIDLLFLIGTILLAFLLENRLFVDLSSELIDLNGLFQKLLTNLPILIGGVALFFLFLYLLFRKFRNHGIVNKFQSFGRQLLTGVKSISTLKNPAGFWVSSLLIWIIYFLTMYSVALGIATTANLTPGQVLLVMVMGSIGMIAPVQGGIGTFHALVAYILIQLGVSESDGKIFAAIIHGIQVLLIVLAGLFSWVLMMRIPAWIKPSKT
jgi:uncharacterized protein (TIRG00374 family)